VLTFDLFSYDFTVSVFTFSYIINISPFLIIRIHNESYVEKVLIRLVSMKGRILFLF
jgi:hypothetical protein